MRHVSEHEWVLLKEQTAQHLRDRTWLGGGHSILPAAPDATHDSRHPAEADTAPTP